MSKLIHLNKLEPSKRDTIELCMAVEQRFKDLIDSHMRIKKFMLIPPSELDSDMKRWREMAVRFKSGDYRNTDGELLALRSIAQWTVDQNCLLRNQPIKKLVWVD